MRVYSDVLSLDDLHRVLPWHCEMAGEEISRPRIRRHGWIVQLSAPGGARWKNTGTTGASSTRAASWDDHGQWFADLFALDPDAHIVGVVTYSGREDFNAQTDGQYRPSEEVAA